MRSYLLRYSIIWLKRAMILLCPILDLCRSVIRLRIDLSRLLKLRNILAPVVIKRIIILVWMVRRILI
jgi:hypothetical protein